MAKQNYTDLLLTAREAADLRLKEKGLDYKIKVDRGDDPERPVHSSSALVPRLLKQKEISKEDLLSEYFTTLRAQNMKMKDEILLAGDVPLGVKLGDSIMGALAEAGVEDDSDLDSFLEKMLKSESSGRFNITTVSDKETGKKVYGGFQFGKARLTDYKNATGSKFTIDEFLADPKLQMRVTKWHFKDLDKLIDKLDTSQFPSRDGLRAVGHLGGRTGLKRFVESGGKKNPNDRLGTTLMKYYNDFK